MGTITTAMCNSFKEELLGGTHDLDTDTLKIALIKESPSSNFGAGTTNFSDLGSDEASGTGYTSGGQNLDSATITLSGSTAFVDFADEVFSTGNFGKVLPVRQIDKVKYEIGPICNKAIQLYKKYASTYKD